MSRSRKEKLERQMGLVATLMKSVDGVTSSFVMQDVQGYNDPSIDPRSRRRKFERDCNELRDQGIVIKTEDNSHGAKIYRLDRSRMMLPNLHLTEDQRLIVYHAARSYVESGGDSSVNHYLAHAMMKLNSGEGGMPLTSPKSIVQRTVLRAAGDQPNVQKLNRAVIERRIVTMKYRASSNEVTERVVEPYGIVCRQSNMYAICRDPSKKGMRCFLLSRVIGKVKLGQKEGQYDIPDDFDPEAHISTLPFGAGGGSFKGAEIRFDSTVAFIIRNELEGTYEIKENRDQSIDVKIDEVWPFEMLRFLTEFAGHWEVRKPKALREFVVKLLSQKAAK